MNYNLLAKPWIPILMTDGAYRRVGIREAFAQAGRIRQIAASNPMDRVAILRFLLALLYWCKGNPSGEDAILPGDSFPADWFSKLDDHVDCFNLLGEGKRFYQYHAAQRSRSATDLLQEIPTGNNFWHFRHSVDRADGLCPACCAMGLLRLPLFSVSGLPDLKSGINGTPPVYVVPWGGSLRETLLANWLPYTSLGEPAWTKPDLRPVPGQEVPLLTGLTLLSRRVWLHDPGPPGSCIGCGAAAATLIRSCMFQSAGELKNDNWVDPHVLYSNATPRKASKAVDLTAAGKFSMDRPWPYLLINMLETGRFKSESNPTTLLVVGFATDQAKNVDVWERTIGISPMESDQAMVTSLVQQWQKESRQLARRITRSSDEGAATLAAIRPHVESRVSTKAGELLSREEATWERAAAEYRPLLEVIAKSLAPGFTTTAVRRRRQIVNALPDMRPKPDTTKKRNRKGEGDS